MKKVDINENGTINYLEFIAAGADEKEVLAKKKLKEAFDFFDLNKDGFI